MADITIRHVREGDAEAIHAILEAPHVVRGTMRLPFLSIEAARERIGAKEGIIKLVAVDGTEVAGYCELVTEPNQPRHRHAGEINMIATHPSFRGRQVGEKLMAAMVDLADNWLQLTRLGLIVWKDNTGAIALYERFGFSVEGTMPNYVFLDGKYVDAQMMGRVRI